jgi:hypothetical protein
MLVERHAPGGIERDGISSPRRTPWRYREGRDLLTKAHTVAVSHGQATVERRARVALDQLKG